jgi:hypothetical protein
MRVPFQTVAEYRGQSPAGTATIDGEAVDYTAGLKFEVDMPDGDVDVWTVRQAKLDEAGDFDSAQLKKGDRVELTGMATVGTRDSERSFIRVVSARRIDQAAKLRAAS